MAPDGHTVPLVSSAQAISPSPHAKLAYALDANPAIGGAHGRGLTIVDALIVPATPR